MNTYTCPCTIAEKPCHSQCACRNPMSSHSCDCCASYGNEEQRRMAAEFIVRTMRIAHIRRDPHA